MAEEEVLALVASPTPTDHKRKLEELEPEAPERVDHLDDSNGEPDENKEVHDVAAFDSSEAKRPRLDDNSDGLGNVTANENGFQTEKLDEREEEEEEAEEPNERNLQAEDGESTLEEVKVTVETEAVKVTVETEEVEVKTINTEENLTDHHDTGATQQASVENNSETGNTWEPTLEEKKQLNDGIPQQEINEIQATSCKIEVPSSKVGVLIGKGGDTIRYLQYNSGAKIQIMRDADADLNSLMRPVEIIGTLTSIEKAEKLINAVIAEADAGGSPYLVARGLPTSTMQAAGAADLIEIQVPNEKVGLIIGRGGENIKSMQAKSGAHIQLIPQHLPEGDGSKERTVRVTGDKKKIEMARKLINDVMNQTVRPLPLSGGFNQQSNRPRGPTGPPQWGPRGPHPAQPMVYDYQQRGHHPSQNHHYQPPNYGSYPPQQMALRNSFGSSWEQGPPPRMQGPPPHGAGYDYYGAQGGHAVSALLSTPISRHAPGPSPFPAIGPPPSLTSYNYGQSHGPDYGHPAPYSQTHQQSYGNMYEEPKYENHAPIQQPYGGPGGSQPGYEQAGGQPGYAPQQQYGKLLAYGTQGPPHQTYGPPSASQPGDMPFQGPVPSAQSYGQSVPHQQQYPYTSGGHMQQTYPPYGSIPPSDGYNQPPATGLGYHLQGGQPVPNYSQPGGQQGAGYGQVGTTSGYVSYPSSQQGYLELPAQNTASYGYQGPPRS